MKKLLVVALALVCPVFLIFGQDAKPADDSKESTEKKKADIKELMALPEFTNHAGILMVKLSDSTWAGKYEVTQEEYQKVTGGNPSKHAGPRNPVDSVNWNECMQFCSTLTDQEQKEEMLPEGFAYTLPTQAEWESWAAGVGLDNAVTSENAPRSGPSPVGSLGPNGSGLFDVRGNVWEWCLDPQDKPFRVGRGGAWNSWLDINLRVDFRWYSEPGKKMDSHGFRCVLKPKAG